VAFLVHVLSAFFPLRTYIVSTFVSDYPKSVSKQNDCKDGDRVQTELIKSNLERSRSNRQILKQSPGAIVRSSGEITLVVFV